MNRAEAEILLNVSHRQGEDEILDAYEEAVFEQASFFMWRTFLPKLAEARIRKLEKIAEGAAALGIKPNAFRLDVSLPNLFEATTIHELVEAYNRGEKELKLVLANCFEAPKASRAFEAWIFFFESYAKRFMELANAEEPREVKISQSPIFIELAAANEKERQELIANEYSRLKRLYG